MAYYVHQTSTTPRTAPPYQHHAQYAGQSMHPQGPRAPVNSYHSTNHTAHAANGQYDPRYAPVTAPQQPRSLSNTQIQQQAPQKAHAVKIPQVLSNRNGGNGYESLSSRPQYSQVVPPLASAQAGQRHLSKPQPQQTRTETPLDYGLLLLSLAEEYFAAAREYISVAPALQRETEMREYYKLVATGLGCLEAVLGRFKLLPEREANVRLWYATVLYEETDNIMVAEEALSKGVSLCDRHRFFDLKYNMQHLIARMLFGKTPRVAFKFLDCVIKDVEAYQHIAWVYAFRFLQVSLHLKLSTHQDILSAIGHLRHIADLSNEYGDKAVLATATIIEALTCLRESNDEDSIEQAQRAVASSRSLQLDPSISELHQLPVLTSIVELCICLQRFDPGQAQAKLQTLQTVLKEINASDSWTADGSFAVPMTAARMRSCQMQNGIIRKRDGDLLVLMFSWMSKDNLFNLGYFFGGFATAHRNSHDGHKSESYFEDGIRRIESKYSSLDVVVFADAGSDADDEHGKPTLTKSMALANSQRTWHEEMTCLMHLHLAFTLCARTSWSAAKEQQTLVQNYIRSSAASSCSVPESLCRLSTYLTAVIYQGTGNLEQALSLYESSLCSLQVYRKTYRPTRLHRDVALLSALNTLLITSNPNHPKHDQFSSLLSAIDHLCVRNPNRQIQSANHLITAIASFSSTILSSKQALQCALQTAKPCDNNQLLCMTLNLMCSRFFRGVVGDQAEKSAQASQAQAQKSMDSLWISVSAGVLGNTLEAAGKVEEAKKMREHGERTAAKLPEELQVVMRTEPA